MITRPAKLRCCGATARQSLTCHVVPQPGVAASEHGMVAGGSSADVIAYTTTQGYGVVVQPYASLGGVALAAPYLGLVSEATSWGGLPVFEH